MKPLPQRTPTVNVTTRCRSESPPPPSANRELEEEGTLEIVSKNREENWWREREREVVRGGERDRSESKRGWFCRRREKEEVICKNIFSPINKYTNILSKNKGKNKGFFKGKIF